MAGTTSTIADIRGDVATVLRAAPERPAFELTSIAAAARSSARSLWSRAASALTPTETARGAGTGY